MEMIWKRLSGLPSGLHAHPGPEPVWRQGIYAGCTVCKMGEYGITLKIVLRIRNIVDETKIRHQFIKEIIRVYQQEDIEILVRHD